MLAAGHETQSEARFVKRDIRADEQNGGNEHEPVELKAPDVHNERLLRLDILNNGGNVVRVRCGVDCLNNDRCGGCSENVERRSDDCLIRLEADAGNGKQRRIQNAGKDGNKDNQQNDNDCRGGRVGRGKETHCQRSAERAHNHYALKAEVDNARMLRKAAAERNKNENRGVKQGVLNEKQHYFTPPFASAL